MSTVFCQEPAIMPGGRITFLLDWELTLKCNLDCSYCDTGIDGGHDNSTKHPPLGECLKTIDFMLEYVDLYMSTKSKAFKHVVLNVYGGEALHHPDIVQILATVQEKYTPYKDRWTLTVTNTTNAIVSDSKFAKIVPYIDKFTFSYHTEATTSQKEQFKRNLLYAKQQGKNPKCIVLLNSQLFDDATEMAEWCKVNNIDHLPRQLDMDPERTEFDYTDKQVIWINKLYNDKSFQATTELKKEESTNLLEQGRACCGGRQISINKNYKERLFWVNNRFRDWSCSVNEFFVYIKQVNGKIYTNKDCRMNFDGQVGPIGSLGDTQSLLDYTREKLTSNSMPVIICKRDFCRCGLCAPKAKSIEDFNDIIKKYRNEK